MSELIVTSLEQYLILPELEMPVIPNENSKGVIYHLTKVGFLRATKKDCMERKIEAIYEPLPNVFLLPTAVVLKDGRQKLYRLPLSLAEWASTLVGMAHAVANPLPSDAEFGILRDRHYADLL